MQPTALAGVPTTMDEEYELQTHRLEDFHWWYRGRREVIDAVVRSLELPSDACILDAGCGSGRNMVELARYGTVTGIELAEASVARARARAVGEVVHGSVYEMPFETASIDFAVSLDVIEHLDDDLLALRELRRVVRPGGRALVTVPAYPWLWSSHDHVNHHRRRYTRTMLDTVVADAGWEMDRLTHFNSVLFPAAAIARGLQRIGSSGRPPRSDLERTPRPLNRILSAPLSMEARLIGRGRSIPVGLSLLVVLS
ncbi:MAG TPA: class I SAM-dependent methyltransferase [Solirubrobacteraceae bacterium]|jgi:SAM-dependent methyltransferase|nr:class I SAM-dependent methyltransferase [Solirubrobacteraceae bacterium]